MYVSIFFVRALAEGVKSRDVHVSTFLERAGLTRAEYEDPTLRVAYDRYSVCLRAARDLLGHDDAAGIEMGMAWPMTGSLLNQLWSNSANLRASLETVVKYRRLAHEGTRIRLVERDDYATAVFENHECDDDHATFEAEATIVYLMRLGRFLTGTSGAPTSVTFIGEEPRDLSAHESFFGVTPIYGADRNALTFPRRLLEIPNLYHDPGIAALLEQRANELLAALDDDARLVSRVRDLLRHAGDPAKLAIDELATRVGTSVRVLQRKLQSRGTSVSELVDEARRSIAIDAIANGSEPIKEVADRLGFSEPSAFHRAFKRWTGETPAELRVKRRSNRPGGPM